VLNCADIFFDRTGPFFQLPEGRFSELSPPPIANFGFETAEINCAAIFFNCTGPFFQFQGGDLRRILGLNCAQIMLNCAAIPFTCADHSLHDAITRDRILRNSF